MELTAMDENLQISIVEATPADVDDIAKLIRELAAYEKAPDEAILTASDLLRDGFGDHPAFHVLLAKANGETVGMAFWFFTYSTWKGKELYLEDLVVKEAWRRRGIGRLLFEELLNLAYQYKVKRMRWQVLHWNEPAFHFYRKYRAATSDQWLNCMLTSHDISRLIENKSHE
ncbi:MAG: GNAT family N-acetyltransferase [Bacteroidales bacterium]|jgi:GNAT superfamily N-acetyltransferase|nr:GNAT family N-acetyltransferase [Bacteroidales bacterium]